MSRWNWKKPQWPTIAPSAFRSTAHGPMPSVAHMPIPPSIRRQLSSRIIGFPPMWRMTSSSASVAA